MGSPWGKKRSCSLFVPDGANKGTGSYIPGHSGDNIQHDDLEVVHADTYISNLALRKIDFIKIDVEGFEGYVLAGLKHTLENTDLS